MSVPALTRLCSLPVFPCPLPLHIPGRIASRSLSGCGESLGTGLALFSFCYSLLLWPLWFNRRLNFLLKGCAQRSHTHSIDKLNLRRQRRRARTATVPHSVYTDVDRSQWAVGEDIGTSLVHARFGQTETVSVAAAKVKASRVRKCPFQQ